MKRYKNPIWAYFSLFGSIIYHMVIGCFYVWGCVSLYCNSYLKKYNPSVTPRILSFFLPLRSIVMLFLNPIGSIMDRKFGPKLGLSVGMIILTLCIFLLTISTNMWAFIIFISIGFGIPTGFAYVPAISCSWRLFPKQKGLISGIILCGFGMGSFIFSYIAKEIVNPYNEAPVFINGQFIYPEAVANRVK